MKRAVCLIIVLLFYPTPNQVSAQDVSFEASVDTKQVQLGASLQLTLTFTGVQNVPAPDLSQAIADFDVQYLGPSTRISIVNGQYSSMVAHIYVLSPNKIGKFQIPPLSVNISGQTLTSEPIDIEVVDTPVSHAPPLSSQGQEDSQNIASLDDKIFLTLEAGKKQAYLHEKISVTVKLFVTGLSVRDIQLPELKPFGFEADQWSRPQQYTQTVGGIQYQVVEFNTFLSPTRTGPLEVGPAKLMCSLLFRRSQRRSPFDHFDDMLGGDLFEDFFGGVQKRDMVLQSANLNVDVLELPEENKPKDFSGAVGQFEFKAQASPNQVKAGDPITLRLTIQGEGNLKSVQLPAIKEDENFKVYDPQVKEENGTKVLEQVLIPKTEKVTEIPALNFSYFDTQSLSYKTIAQGPFPIEVAKPEATETFKIVETPQEGMKSPLAESLGRDIVFIKEHPGNLRPIGSHVYKSFLFWCLVIFSLVGFAVTLVVFHRQQRLKTDVVYARRLKAPLAAKKGLAAAQKLIEKEDPREFYDGLFQTLKEYLGHKFHLPAGTISVVEISQLLKAKRQEALSEKIKSIFDECEMVRYASATVDKTKMKEIFQKTQEIIDALERVNG